MMRPEKILIIVLLMVPLALFGIWEWRNIEANSTYPLNDLLMKYPLISQLKMAVDSGELDYNKLPDAAKEALQYYDSQDSGDVSIIGEINP